MLTVNKILFGYRILKLNLFDMAIELDKTDYQILKILQETGRITNLQLSTNVGLSPAPTLERVRKLENAGYIKSYHALVDEELLGLGIKTFIQIQLDFHENNTIQVFNRNKSN